MKRSLKPRKMGNSDQDAPGQRPVVVGAESGPQATKSLEAGSVTLEEALAAAGVGAFQRRVWLLCGLAVSADGVEKAALMYILQGVSQAWGVQGEALGLLGSVSGLGQAFGAYTFGRYSDAYGRRTALVVALAVTFVLGSLCAVAPSYVVFLVLRFLVNVALGGALPCAFTLLAEFLPPSDRPKWIPFLYAMYGVGRLVTALMAWILLDHSWRLYMFVLAVPCGILLFLKGWIPESPHFLLAQEQPSEARRVIQEVAEANGTTLPFGPCAQLRCEEDKDQGHADGWLTVLQSSAAKLLCVMWLLTALGSEWFNWALKLMKASGVPSTWAYAGLTLFNTNELVVPLVLAVLQRSSFMERARWTLAGSCALACFTLLALAACMRAGAQAFVAASVLASYSGIAVWVFHYTVTPSYFATEVRGTGFGTCMAFNRLGYIVGPLIAAGMISSSHVAILFFCAACYCVLTVFALFLRSSPEGACEEGETTRLAEVH